VSTENVVSYASMPDLFRDVLGQIPGGRVLDVATAEGGFVEILMDNLSSYTDILGIDVEQEALEAAWAGHSRCNVHFARMDAELLGLPSASFDTVNASASLHHLAHVPRVLAEMARVLRPGGRLILTEMHSDGRTAGQTTTIYLHQWIAAVDAALGVHHYRTLGRQEILDHVGALGLCDVACYDFSDTRSDPLDQESLERMRALIDATIERARTTWDAEALKLRGEQLRQRLEQFGTQREPVLLVVCIK
jgi:SAM-dependent methyltransferase